MQGKPQAVSTPRAGRFSIAPGRTVDGELCLAGDSTSLALRDFDDLNGIARCTESITGTLHDLTKVTLIQCITTNSGSTSSDSESTFHASLFPHYVVEGFKHLDPTEPTIKEIALVLDDADALFYDFGIFGEVQDPRPHIERLVAANGSNYPIEIGPSPQILYFTGKRDIIETKTSIGILSAHHNISGVFPHPGGVRLDNTVSVHITTDGITFREAITRATQLIQFMHVAIGRPQNIMDMTVVAGSSPERLRVHWSFCPKRRPGSSDRASPHPGDLPLDPIRYPDEFSRVISSWFEHREERRDARNRFQTCVERRERFTVDRLVGAANMFDILPPSAVPPAVNLTTELHDARARCRTIFRDLTQSYERDSVLNALGRIGKPSLKHKVRHRASLITSAVGDRFPDLIWALEQAIDCRNHYVHGTSSTIDFSAHPGITTFLTKTLEFVFAASELVEAGWDIGRFMDTPTAMTHPFGAYRVEYSRQLHLLKSLVDQGR